METEDKAKNIYKIKNVQKRESGRKREIKAGWGVEGKIKEGYGGGWERQRQSQYFRQLLKEGF